MKPRFRKAAAPPLVLALALAATACGDDSTEGTGGMGGAAGSGGAETGTTAGQGPGGGDAGTGGAGGDGLITTECGTFDPNEPGDGVIPDDPTDPAIVTSCEAFCDAFGSVCENGGFFRDECVDDCRLRACGICPGTIQPLVDCETTDTDVAACGCQDGVPVCERPDSCGDLDDATTQCGG